MIDKITLYCLSDSLEPPVYRSSIFKDMSYETETANRQEAYRR